MEASRESGSHAIAADSSAADRSPEEIRADIEEAREELGETVAALAERTDVKAQAAVGFLLLGFLLGWLLRRG